MSYEKLFKYIQYYPDGSGRDSYINSNSGGFSRFMPKQLIQKYSSYPRAPVYNFKDLRKTSWAIKYKSDGSGRDSYIISNSGGLVYDWKEGVKFDKSLRTTNSNINKTKYTDLRISKSDFANSLKIKKIQDSVTNRLYTANTNSLNSNCRFKIVKSNKEEQSINLNEKIYLETDKSKNSNHFHKKNKTEADEKLRLLTSSASIRNKNKSKIKFNLNPNIKFNNVDISEENKSKEKTEDKIKVTLNEIGEKSLNLNQNLQKSIKEKLNLPKNEVDSKYSTIKFDHNLNHQKSIEYQNYYRIITDYNQKSAKNIGKLKIVFPSICTEFK